MKKRILFTMGGIAIGSVMYAQQQQQQQASKILEIDGQVKINTINESLDVVDKALVTTADGMLKKKAFPVETWSSTTNAVTVENKNVGIGTSTPAAKLDVVGYIKVGSSDEIGDNTPQLGMIRFNTTTNKFQGYTNTGWVDLHN